MDFPQSPRLFCAVSAAGAVTEYSPFVLAFDAIKSYNMYRLPFCMLLKESGGKKQAIGPAAHEKFEN